MVKTIFILNQDRDEFIRYDKRESRMEMKPVYYHQNIIGYNIEIDYELVGTYYDEFEARREMARIKRWGLPIFIASGYSAGLKAFE